MQQRLTLLFLLAFLAISHAKFGDFFNFGTFVDIAKDLNYPVEIHKITTQDGYILTFFRIQAKGQTSLKSGLPVIYLQHGFIDSSDTWIVNEESAAPGFRLANQGYDVWLGNSRGNKYSMEHVTLKNSNAKFWEFSWQHMAEFDLPAAFEYIHQHTNQQITYIGHSQGTTIMFAALSEQNPVIQKYLKKYIAFNPVAYVSKITSGPMLLMANSPLETVMKTFHINQFMPSEFLTSSFGSHFCKMFSNVCGDFLKLACGADPELDNYARSSFFMKHIPSGTSAQDAIHWKQLVKTARFTKFDFGGPENVKRYGRPTPPDYNLGNIKVPVYMFLGKYDTLVNDIDLQSLLRDLSGSVSVKYQIYSAGHMTFLWSKNDSFYFNDLLNILKK